LLLRLAKDEDQSIRMFTHSALLRFAANSEEAQSVLKRAISESERNVRWNLLTNLGGQGDHPDVDPDVAVSLLIAALESPGFYDGVGADVPNRAILALGNYGRKAKPAVPVLIMALQRRIPAADLNVMNRAAQALGKIGPGAKDAIPALQEARKAAVEAAGDRLQPGVYTDENANDEAALARACAAALKKIRSE
jgi:HEAT repeat protein